MAKKQITFNTSVPDQSYIDLIDEMARRSHRSRSQQVCHLIMDEARRLGLVKGVNGAVSRPQVIEQAALKFKRKDSENYDSKST